MKRILYYSVMFLTLVGIASTSLAVNPNHAYFTLEPAPDAKINRVDMSSPMAVKVFRSVNTTVAGGPPEPFQLVFPVDFDGNFSTQGNVTTPDPYTPGVDPVVFSSGNSDELGNPCRVNLGGSLGIRDCLEIRIKLLGSARNLANGFTYEVRMQAGAYTLDPRLRGQ